AELLQDPTKNQPIVTATPVAEGNTSTGIGVSTADFSPEVKAFLDVIASHEVPNYLDPSAYTVMSLTSEKFSGFADHPRRKHRSGRLVSDAAGRYQFLSTSWDEFKVKAGVKDFSPRSQDLAAVAYLKQLSAFTAINNGDLEGAIRKSATTWASLPGSPYGQPVQTMAQARKTYTERLAYYKGQTAAAAPTSAAESMDAPVTPPAEAVAQEIAPTVEVSNKGTEIIIEVAVGVGVTFKDAIAFHFIHTSTDTSWDASGAQITTFGGKSIRWLLTRVPVTQSFENINLKQYTELQASGFNLKLEMEGSGLTFQHLSQDGQTALATLFREANRTGFRIAEGTGKKSDTLIVEPFARPQFTNFIIDEEVLIKPVRFTDKARAASSNAPAATVSTPETGTGETKTAIDRATGALAQTKPESKAGTGQAVGSGGTTGATAPAVGGTVKPDAATASTTTPAITPSTVASASQETKTQKVEGPVKVTKEDGTVVVTTITTEQTLEPGKIVRTKTTSTTTTKPNAQPVKVDKVVAVTVTEGKTVTKTTVYEPQKAPAVTTKEEPKVSAEDKKLLEQSKLKSNSEAAPGAGATASADPVTGLPNQQAGFIDLQDGRAEAQVIADESRRVKGYEDDCVLVMNQRTLQLVPGEIVALSKRLFPDVFATEKRIGSVNHDVGAGTVGLQFYTPQAAAPASSGAVAPATPGEVTQFAAPALAPGGFIFPVLKPTTIGDGYGTRANRRAGYRHKILDVTGASGSPIIAMADGVVTQTVTGCVKGNKGCGSGFGNYVAVQHGGGYDSLYAHCLKILVAKGQQVKQGQTIATMGSTGSSSGEHLHLVFNLNGSYCLLSKVGIDVLKMGIPVHRYNQSCNQY
ncbi:MAG TPA: peptidoglycan DD-metalloendopeptidase family protein, partial [Thermosynechococcaceae cyanobacterium]